MLKTLLYLFCPWLEIKSLRKENAVLARHVELAATLLHNNVAGVVLAAGGEVFVPAAVVDFVGRHDFVALKYAPEPGGVRVTVGVDEGEDDGAEEDEAGQDIDADAEDPTEDEAP